MADEKKAVNLTHNIVMENRKNLSVSGVKDVDSFDEETVIALTSLGEMTVRGEKLHINSLDLDTGEMSISGEISSISYLDTQNKSGGFLSRVFR